jgi:serine/threonine-protein kinase
MSASSKTGNPLEGTGYRLLGRIGAGSMGEVFDAEHLALSRRVVIKLLRPEYARSRGAFDRMRVEAQSLAKLDSALNIVRVLDFGTTRDGRAFLVMEKLHGAPLNEELHRVGCFSVPHAIALARQILAGLTHAHTAGFVHRDLKPGNLFVCDAVRGKRVVKILDFGIVKMLAAASTAPDALRPLAVPTEEGTALGTPRYMSPEQALGKPNIDDRTDLYSVGAILYALLTGRGPFDHHRGMAEIMAAQVTESAEPPSRRASQPIPADLDAAVLRALEKDPAKRFQSASAFSAELARCLEASARQTITTELLPSNPALPSKTAHGTDILWPDPIQQALERITPPRPRPPAAKPTQRPSGLPRPRRVGDVPRIGRVPLRRYVQVMFYAFATSLSVILLVAACILLWRR